MLFQIKSWIDASVLFECEVPDNEPAKVRCALKLAAGKKANLSEADLSEANLSEANLSGANLSGADLSEANLSEAKLSEAKLSGANLYVADLYGQRLLDLGLRSDGYRFFLTNFGDEGWRIKAGCRNYAWTEARGIWQASRGGTQLGEETMAILDHAERMACVRGWDLSELAGCAVVADPADNKQGEQA